MNKRRQALRKQNIKIAKQKLSNGGSNDPIKIKSPGSPITGNPGKEVIGLGPSPAFSGTVSSPPVNIQTIDPIALVNMNRKPKATVDITGGINFKDGVGSANIGLNRQKGDKSFRISYDTNLTNPGNTPTTLKSAAQNLTGGTINATSENKAKNRVINFNFNPAQRSGGITFTKKIN